MNDQATAAPSGVSSLPRPAGELQALEAAWRAPVGLRRLSAVNNTQIGLYYIATALVFFLLAGVLGLLIRAQLALPGQTLLSPTTYNQVFTMHGTVMMFLFAVPMVEAMAVYLLPGMLGARDLPFPRLSAYAFWAYAVGGAAFFCTLFFGLAPDGGWFMYPPLTSTEHSPGLGADFWLLGIGFIEISAIAGAIELIIGILFTRAPGMTLRRMPVFAWAMLVVAVMIVFAFPAVIAGTTLLELERAFDWPFFLPERGGDPLLWQHLFWFFGHPEVYIIFLPAAGLVSMMIPVWTRTPLLGHGWVVGALAVVGVISFALWAHHMFTAGLSPWAAAAVSAASMVVAIPTAVQVFAWLATLWRGRLVIGGAALFLLGFLFIFVLGGLTGVMVAVLPFDWQVHDTYFIVAHLHYVLIGGLVFPMFAALYHWTPLINGHTLSEAWARVVFGLMFVGFNLAFFPMHVSGLLGMPRRVYTYDAGLGWTVWNLASSVGAAVFAAGIALFLLDAARVWRRPKQAHGNPWGAATLEWLPGGDHSTRSIPEVTSLTPLWSQPSLPEEVVQGRHWLPGTVTGRRETLVTGVRCARPQHLMLLPGDGWTPLLAGVGTAGFFLLLTVKWVLLAWACGLTAIGAACWWMWASDRAPPLDTARIADGVQVPIGASGWRSPSWWATVVLVVVDATIGLSLAFAHLHLSMRAEVCPPPGASLPSGMQTTWAVVLWAASAGLALVGLWPAPEPRNARRGATLVGLATLLACAAFAVAIGSQLQAGLAPTADAWSATVATLLAWQGLHAVILVILGAYLGLRWWCGLVTRRSHATRDNITTFWLWACLQSTLMLAFVQTLPGLSR